MDEWWSHFLYIFVRSFVHIYIILYTIWKHTCDSISAVNISRMEADYFIISWFSICSLTFKSNSFTSLVSIILICSLRTAFHGIRYETFHAVETLFNSVNYLTNEIIFGNIYRKNILTSDSKQWSKIGNNTNRNQRTYFYNNRIGYIWFDSKNVQNHNQIENGWKLVFSA